jgi:hypothetical protein
MASGAHQRGDRLEPGEHRAQMLGLQRVVVHLPRPERAADAPLEAGSRRCFLMLGASRLAFLNQIERQLF